MADCSTRPVYRVTQPRRYGVPEDRVFKPLVRINGVIQDAPQGYKIDACYLPNALVTPVTSSSVSPTTGTGAATSTGFGTPGTYLGTPAAWGTVAVGGTNYLIPLYAVPV